MLYSYTLSFIRLVIIQVKNGLRNSGLFSREKLLPNFAEPINTVKVKVKVKQSH
jgi:hypothetical protein